MSCIAALSWPQPHLVAHGEAADHDGDGQGDDEHAAQGAQPAHELAHESPDNEPISQVRCDAASTGAADGSPLW